MSDLQTITWAAELTPYDPDGPVNLVTSDDVVNDWAAVNTPAVTASVSDPDGGTGAYTIADNDGTLRETVESVVALTGDGICVFVVRENAMPATGYQLLLVYDNDAAVDRFGGRVTGWSSGKPSVTATSGTLLGIVYVGNGYWAVVGQTSGVVPANENVAQIRPAQTASETGSIDLYRVNVFDATEDALIAISRLIVDAGERAALLKVRVADHGFLTTPSDDPPNTLFLNRIPVGGLTMPRRDIVREGAVLGRTKVSTGTLSIAMGDGDLDRLMGYAWDGRDVTVYRGVQGDTFPDNWQSWALTVDTAEGGLETLNLRLREKPTQLDVPIQQTLYAGTGGLEGGSDLEGKPKPIALGGTSRQVPAVLVEPNKLIYGVSDGAVSAIQPYDGGLKLGQNIEGVSTSHQPSGNVAASCYDPVNSRVIVVTSDGDFAFYNGSWTDITSTDFGSTAAYAVAARSSAGDGTDADVVIGGASGTLYTFTGANLGSGTGTSRTSQFSTNAIRAALYITSEDRWVIVGDGGKISVSDDGGATWTAKTSGVSSALYWVVLLKSRLIAGGASGVMRYSDDYGDTWSAVGNPSFGTDSINACVVGKGRAVAVGENNKTAVTADGLQWTQNAGADFPTSSPPSDNLNGIGYVNGRFIAVGDGNMVMDALYGDQWTLRYYSGGTTEALDTVAEYEDDGSIFVSGVQDDGTTGISFISEGPKTYASQADILDDTQQPAPGSYGVYLAGGLFRLGLRPTDCTADVTAEGSSANRTHGQLLVDVFGRCGLSNQTDLVTQAMSAWTDGAGSVTRAGSQADPAGGTGAYLLTDDDSGIVESMYTTPSFTGDGTKVVRVRLKAGTATATGVALYDATAAAQRHRIRATWSSGVPTVSTISGSGILGTPKNLGGGWWEIGFTVAGVVAGNTNRLYLYPSDVTGTTGTVYGYEPEAYDSAALVGPDAWNRLDVVAMDNANSADAALWIGPDERLSGIDVAQKIVASCGAWFGTDRSGVYRARILTAPGSGGHSFTKARIKDLERLPVRGDTQIPPYEVVVRYNRNYSPRTTGILLGVSDSFRAELARQWMEVASTDTDIQAAHVLSSQLIIESLFVDSGDAQTEADRLLPLHGTRRDRYEFRATTDDDTLALDLGDDAELVYDRLDLTSGKDFVLLTEQVETNTGFTVFGAWG